MTLFDTYLFDNDTPDLAQTINNINAGIWELDIITKKVKWSVGFYNILGYTPGEIECSYLNLIDNLTYHQDRDTFLSGISTKTTNHPEVTYIRLLTKRGFEWFQNTIQRRDNRKIVGTIINVNQFKFLEFELETNSNFVAETNRLIKVGGWEIDPVTSKLFISVEALHILELESQIESIAELIDHLEQGHQQTLKVAIENCIETGRPFNLDLQLKTGKGNVIWVKIKAVADIDDYGKCLLIKGIIQDIDLVKKQEESLKTSLDTVNHNNKRLQNFAYIVSHNLRSYAGNLKLMINLHEESKDVNDQKEILSHIKSISNSLDITIKHLTEIVTIDSNKEKEKTLIEFELLFKNIINALKSNIQETQATINYDFTKCRHVYYLPAYLESIFHNLLSNAIKYRSLDRPLLVNCESYIQNDDVYVVFNDNGTGIDLNRFGDKIFGLYQKFHNNQDAQGVGLYITRNQIESLGGSINVESTVGVGTKFLIKLT
jgi:signal transduction histidine kinase